MLEEVAGRVVLAVRGELDLATLPTFRDHLSRAVQRNPGQAVFVDLDEVASADDVALCVLLAAAAHARRNHGEVRVVCSLPHLRDRLAELRLDQVVSVGGSLTADPAA